MFFQRPIILLSTKHGVLITKDEKHFNPVDNFIRMYKNINRVILCLPSAPHILRWLKVHSSRCNDTIRHAGSMLLSTCLLYNCARWIFFFSRTCTACISLRRVHCMCQMTGTNGMTCGIWKIMNYHPWCVSHYWNQLHVKHLANVTLNKEISTNCTLATSSLPILFYRSLGIYRVLPDTRQIKVVVTATGNGDGAFAECAS